MVGSANINHDIYLYFSENISLIWFTYISQKIQIKDIGLATNGWLLTKWKSPVTLKGILIQDIRLSEAVFCSMYINCFIIQSFDQK